MLRMLTLGRTVLTRLAMVDRELPETDNAVRSAKSLAKVSPGTIECAKRWVLAYAADRARRGIPKTGIYYDGEDPMRHINRKAGHN